MIPPYWFLIAVLSASALAGWFSHDYTKKGYENQISEMKLAYSQEMIAEQIKQSDKEHKTQAAVDAESESYFKKRMDNETTIDNLLSGISDGTKRVFVSTREGSCSAEVQNTKSPTGVKSNNRAELSAEASRSVIEIGSKANLCAINYNSLLKRYQDLITINKED